MDNPLLSDIRQLLDTADEPLTEFAIHQSLKQHGAFGDAADGGLLGLFHRHFLVMNALYQLQQQYWQTSKQVLRISPLHIQLQPCAHDAHSGLPDAVNSVAAFYLDWGNFEQTDEAEVKALLESFWQQYYRLEARSDALLVLQLDSSASPSQIEHRYRRLAARHHPDKGGDAELFIRIRNAYEQLR